jgi:hypothetical protein
MEHTPGIGTIVLIVFFIEFSVKMFTTQPAASHNRERFEILDLNRDCSIRIERARPL